MKAIEKSFLQRWEGTLYIGYIPAMKDISVFYHWRSTNTPLKLGTGETMPNLDIKELNCADGRDLVNTSANCSEVGRYVSSIKPSITLSLVKWQSNSICFVRSWKTGFLAICRALWFWQCNVTGFHLSTPISSKSLMSQVTSDAALAIALYSASAEDLETVCCFLLFQLIL